MITNPNFYNDARRNAKALWNAIETLQAMQDQWNALDYGNTLADGDGNNAGLTKDDVGAVVFATTNAFKGLFSAGHATNLAKLL